MPDKNFYRRGGPFSLKDLARISGAEIGPDADPDYEVQDVAPLETAGKSDLSFLDNPKYKDDFKVTKAGVCILRPELVANAPRGVQLLLSKAPYRAYARAAAAFYPDERPKPLVSDKAFVDPSAVLGKGCIVEPGAVIRAGAKIGDDCWIESHAVIGTQVVLGAHVRVGPQASVTYALIGSNVYIYPGARIGQDGFGFAPGPEGHLKIPQLGRVIIGDHVEIGANTTIDRGSGPDTVIGEGTWIDNMVQVAHNVKIGKGCIIAAQCGISGSAVLEDYVMMGGQIGISGHLIIGKGARIAAKSGVTSNVPAGTEYMGYPARPMREYLKGVAMLNRLIKNDKSP